MILLAPRKRQQTSLYVLPDNEDFYISSVTLYELYMGAASTEKIDNVKQITEDLVVPPFDEDVAQRAAEISTIISGYSARIVS